MVYGQISFFSGSLDKVPISITFIILIFVLWLSIKNWFDPYTWNEVQSIIEILKLSLNVEDSHDNRKRTSMRQATPERCSDAVIVNLQVFRQEKPKQDSAYNERVLNAIRRCWTHQLLFEISEYTDTTVLISVAVGILFLVLKGPNSFSGKNVIIVGLIYIFVFLVLGYSRSRADDTTNALENARQESSEYLDSFYENRDIDAVEL